jgi:HAD superfamily hydrolase (TIGR01509 family)
MIQALIFDLDGTLVQTERLKALSYARAAKELCGDNLDEETVYTAFTEVVGLPRREVALFLLERFGIEEAARTRMEEFGVPSPWQAFVQIRLRIYEDMLSDSELIRQNQWAHNVALLQAARQDGCKTGLATMSYCAQVTKILKILDLSHAFDFVATRDDVEQGKPDPEIYLLVSRELHVKPEQCLVIEDSPIGVKAARDAGMEVIAVSTPLTQRGLHQSNLLPLSRIVDDPRILLDLTARIVADHREKI